VLSGPTDQGRLNQVARLVYDQTEKTGGLSSVRTNVPIPTLKIWNQDTENLESRHRRVSNSHQMLTRK